jgi:hypothetical protein
MPVVVLQLLEPVTWLSYWELAACAGAVIVVVVRPYGCDEHEWPEKLGGVALHCIALGLLRKDRGLRLQAPLLLEGSVAITRLRQRGCGIPQSRHDSISTSSRSSSYPPIYMVVV